MGTQIFSWPATEPAPLLTTNKVHVWAWSLDRTLLVADWRILSEAETARARRFAHPQDRDRYVIAHSVMRTLLSRYSGIHADEIAFSTNAYGKPQIQCDEGAEQIQFNLSHSAGVAVLAVSRGHQLGIDIEQIRPIDPLVAEHHFSPRELLTLGKLPSGQWLAGFYRCWTSKEALLKGEGLGLNLALDGFDVEVDPQLPPELIAVQPNTRVAANWRLVELVPAQNIVGTLAILDQEGTFKRTSLRYFALGG